MGRAISLIIVNCLFFLILLFLVNWACGWFLKKTDESVKREDLPNYAPNRELAYQIFEDYRKVQHQYEPFTGWKMLPYLGKTLHINNYGERTHLAPQSDSIKEKTVLFFGGSTLWGEGSDDQHTIPALFNEKFPTYAVFNLAQLAYNSRQELDALISYYSKEKEPQPDLVIFYDGVNEAAFLCPAEITDLPAHRLVPLFRKRFYLRKLPVLKELFYLTFLENINKVINRYTKVNNNDSPYNCLSSPGKAEEIAEILMRNWELAHEVVTNRGGKFIAVLQPAAFVGNPKIEHLSLDEDLKIDFTEVYRIIRQKISERNHEWIYDLSNAFDRDEYIYIDFCHVSPNGNQIIADELEKIVSSPHESERVRGREM